MFIFCQGYVAFGPSSDVSFKILHNQHDNDNKYSQLQ